MGVKYKVNRNSFPNMNASIDYLKGKKVKAGIFDGEMAWLAAIHEYGCVIPITPKMRAWLHYNGLHVKKSTTQIVIPERAFIRNGFDKYHEEVLDKIDNLLRPALEGNTSAVDTMLNATGLLLQSKLKLYARDLNSPQNHPFTVARKGSSNPLVDSGAMINSITYKVE